MSADPIFEKRLLLKKRQWAAIERDLQTEEPERHIDLRLEERSFGEFNVHDQLDRMAQEAGLNGLGDRWVEIDKYTAGAVLHRMVFSPLTSARHLVEQVVANTTTEHLIDTFRGEAKFFTNLIAFDEDGISSWNPASNAQFDAVLGIADELMAGLIAVRENAALS